MQREHVEQVLDILSGTLTPAQVNTWMNMTFSELGGASPLALLKAGDVKSVIRHANFTAHRDVIETAAP